MNPVNFPDYQSKSVAEFMAKAKQRTPNLPEIPDGAIRLLRAKLILEEALETVEALGFNVVVGDGDYRVSSKTIAFEADHDPDMVAVADGCGDIKVVVVGTELAFGLNGKPIFEEIMESNMTKDFENSDGIMKVKKGPNYRPPNIEKVLREQGWKQ